MKYYTSNKTLGLSVQYKYHRPEERCILLVRRGVYSIENNRIMWKTRVYKVSLVSTYWNVTNGFGEYFE